MRYAINRVALILCILFLVAAVIGIEFALTRGFLLDHTICQCVCGLLFGVIYLATRPQPIPGPNTCRQCGYDLRASVLRCPECGTVIQLPLAEGEERNK